MEDYLRSSKHLISAQNTVTKINDSESEIKQVEKVESLKVEYKDALNNT